MPKKQQAPLCRLTGTVVHGKGKGHTVGMPTANLQPGSGQVLPPEGVYAALAEVGGQTYRAVTNVGRRPTVDSESRKTVESLLLDYTGDLYGREMELRFYRRLRTPSSAPAKDSASTAACSRAEAQAGYPDAWERKNSESSSIRASSNSPLTSPHTAGALP